MAQFFNLFVDSLILPVPRSLVLSGLQREAALISPADGLKVFQTRLRSSVEGYRQPPTVSTEPGSCMPGLIYRAMLC